MDQKRSLTSFLIIFLFVLGFSIAQYTEHQKPINPAPAIVQSAPEIEHLWEIEDTRSESPLPLVTYLENNGSPLGYDAQSNTFYCTLGLDTGENWPEIMLTAPEASGVSICFVDDYTYDWCDEAIAEGYSYELMAYTNEAYHYFNLVFTGLPIVSLYTQQTIGLDEYVPAYAAISSSEHSPVRSLAKTHLRGSTFNSPDLKESYRIEFHRINQTGKDKKNSLSLLGMPEDTDWLLVSNARDPSQVRNHLAWDMWNRWNPDGNAFSLLQSRMVEVFVNDEYVGLYQLMQRIDTDADLIRMGGNLNTDCAFRILQPTNEKSRIVKSYKDTADVHIELRKPPLRYSEESAFDILKGYEALADVKQGILDDAEFLETIAQHMDIEELMSFFLFYQAISTQEDNAFNNLYIWTRYNGNSYRYSYGPWDMDCAFSLCFAEASKPLMEGEDSLCLDHRIPVRLLNIDGMNSREILWNLWIEKRNTLLTDDFLYQWFHETEDLVNLSGAYRRNSEKWYGTSDLLDINEIYNFELRHLETLDRFMREAWPYGEYTPEGTPTIILQ